jgi:hypothetical protein
LSYDECDDEVDCEDLLAVIATLAKKIYFSKKLPEALPMNSVFEGVRSTTLYKQESLNISIKMNKLDSEKHFWDGKHIIAIFKDA